MSGESLAFPRSIVTPLDVHSPTTTSTTSSVASSPQLSSSQLATSQKILSTDVPVKETTFSATPVSEPTSAAQKTAEVGQEKVYPGTSEPGLLKRAWNTVKHTVAKLPNIFAPMGVPTASVAVQAVPVVVSPVFSAADLAESAKQAKHHDDNLKNMMAHKFQPLSQEEMKPVRDARVDAIKGSGEIEKLFGLQPGKQPNIEALVEHVKQNPEMDATQKQLVLGFLKGCQAEMKAAYIATGKEDYQKGEMTHDDFANRYADHTIAMSIMARGALQNQSQLKMQLEGKMFNIQRDVKAWNFGAACSTAAVWVAMNIVTLTATTIPAAAAHGIGWGLAAAGWGLAAVGIIILAVKKPETCQEYLHGSFIRRDASAGFKKLLQHGLFYNKRIARLDKQIADLPKDDPKREKLEAKASGLRTRLEALDRSQAKHQNRIDTAGIKDYMAKQGYDKPSEAQKKQELKPYTADNFMVEVIEIASAEMGRGIDDTLTKDMHHSLTSMGMTEVVKEGAGERREQISTGVRRFLGAESTMMDEINLKVRSTRRQAQLAIIEQALFGEGRNDTFRDNTVMSKLGMGIEINDDRAASDPKYRREVIKQVRHKLKGLHKHQHTKLAEVYSTLLHSQVHDANVKNPS